MLVLALPLLALVQSDELPEVAVDRDNVRVERSARLVAGAAPVVDLDGNGVVHVVGDGVTVVLDGHLRGAAAGVDPDAYNGIGVRVTGKDVTLRGARVSGYKAGIWATGADGLVVEDCDVSDNFRQRLSSTPEAEDAGDWLRPHENDGNEWLLRYGAGIYVEDASGVTVRRCRARRGQNGLLLDRVDGSRVYDNDFSFLSGWGLGMWRSSENVVSRNAFDFCVRGYSHGVYNRGQDSAGILVFEQCSDNSFVENSATHSGDGFFGFAGKEALGEAPPPAKGFSYERRGCNDNLLLRNDFSYAPAHGIEITFSFGNRLIGNRLVQNAICGVWGGYSQDTLVARNEIAENGEMPYGLERGGVNVEHGRRNRVVANEFRGNACGVHLWWDEDPHLRDRPWAKANGTDCEGTVVAGNSFTGDEIAVQLRGCEETRLVANRFEDVSVELALEGPEPVREDGEVPPVEVPADPVPGESHPVGARAHLRGRDRIVMTEWGPYDWEGPLLRRRRDAEGRGHVWELLGEHAASGVRLAGPVTAERDGRTIRVTAQREGAVAPYELVVATEAGPARAEGTLVDVEWTVRVFGYEADPREEVERWRKEGERGASFRTRELDLAYGTGGPADLPGVPDEVRRSGIPADRFGTIAETVVVLPAGRWRIRTRSDDGIRVWVGNGLVVDDWTHHAPRGNDAELEIPATRAVPIRVEHFEHAGAAVLSVAIDPVAP